jgi:2-keto-4-pentenoate hydratase/2-oxohepta-3-ene-1,7-dioic acid hydratase in catechol pathway
VRLASIDGRAQLVRPADAEDSGAVGGRFELRPAATVADIATASGGRFGPSVEEVLSRWEEFRAWAQSAPDLGVATPLAVERLGPVVASPRQVFAVGLNYRAHAQEAGMGIPNVPLVFTKFPSCVAGPFTDVPVPTPQVDWEVEVTVVVGSGGHHISAADAWSRLAGVTCAQDYSARDTQFASNANAQFSLGKSYPAFLPLGPLLVTPDEYADPDAIGLSCSVNGVQRQSSNTSDLIFGVPELVEYISSICSLLPGDLILTGTPAGVGMGLDPQVFLRPGDEVVSRVDLVGEMRQRCVAP